MHKRPSRGPHLPPKVGLPWSQTVLDEIEADHERCHDEYRDGQERVALEEALSRVPTLFDGGTL